MSVERVQRLARDWIRDQGLVSPGDSRGAGRRRLAEWRARLPSTPRPDRLAWAREVVARYEAGDGVPGAGLTLAMEVLGLTTRPPRRVVPPPPSPDARERQAHDVEPAF